MIVGEAWGKDEELQKKPFVGAAGRLLNRGLEEAGINRETDCYVTNVFQIRPPQNDVNYFFSVNANDSFVHYKRHVKREFYKELVRLFQEIKDVAPKVIVALGNTPLWALTGEMGITQFRGRPINMSFGTVLPICHPAYVARKETTAYPTFVNDFRLAKELSEK